MFLTRGANFLLLLFVCGLAFLTSCSVKNYPPDTPFVYQNRINVKGNISKDDKKRLTAELGNYWDDSLKARWRNRFLVSRQLSNPPAFDSIRLQHTLSFMESYLRSQGYYHAVLHDSVPPFDTVGNQIRAKITININTGKPTLIDSFAFDFADSAIQKITQSNIGKSLIKKGHSVFTTASIAAELDRNILLLRQNGYFKLTREDIVAHVDTSNSQLFNVYIDPAEQLNMLIDMEIKKQQQPTASVVFKLRSQVDAQYRFPENLKQYYVDSVFYYPEYNGIEVVDSFISYPFAHTEFRNFIVKKDDYKMFRFHPMSEQTFIRKKQLYNESRYYRTLNTLGQLGAWNQVDAAIIPSDGDSLNFHILLVPAQRYNFTANLEASRNTGDFLGSVNLFGLALNTTVRDKNFRRKAFQQIINVRNGVELSFAKNTQLLQTLQSSASYTLSLPRLRWPSVVDSVLSKIYRHGFFGLRLLNVSQQQWTREGAKTIFNIGGSYTDRQEFFRLRSLTSSAGFEWRRGNNTWSIRFPNIELYSLDTLDGLRQAFQSNPFLQSAFNTGTIIGGGINYTKLYPDKNNATYINQWRFGFEFSGLPGTENLLKDLYQYVKGEAEYVRTKTFTKVQGNKNEIAWRTFLGVGVNYGKGGMGTTLPFYKQFVAGGPNSMRAWGLRQLGLGSSIRSDTSSTFTDRFGDMQLETNLEYRKKLFAIGSATVDGAAFIDAGNIWNLNKVQATDSSVFSFKRLWQDIAIGTGVGLRLDFSYFLVRIDFGIKLKDPARRENNGWLLPNFTWKNDEYAGKPVKNNWALQLGVGLPF